MFLYFNDASKFLYKLEERGMPHGGKIIKVFASPFDPRELIDRPIAVANSSPTPFLETEGYNYPNRGLYTGSRLEADLQALGLNVLGQSVVRALSRFSNRDDLLFCQYAMGARTDEGWLIDHPFGDIHGIDPAQLDPERRSGAIHLDIFSRRSVPNLKKVFDHDDKELLVTDREMLKLVAEVSRRGIEA